MPELRLPAQQFRAMPAPNGVSRVGLFYCPASGVPEELANWREVNPREINARTATYNSIVSTLMEEPARFHERNRGVTIVAKDVAFDDKRHEVVITLEDPAQHGVVDGSHTLHAVLEGKKAPPEGGWPAYVFITVKTGLDPAEIAEVAGGLNTSQQVDLKSLENLRDHFSALQEAIAGQPYAEQIAYKMYEAKPIDVREILYYLAVFDCATYDGNRHPVALFGRKEGIVRQFARQAKAPSPQNPFEILTSKAADILRLRDVLEKRALGLRIGHYKANKKARIRSESNRENFLYFLNEKVNGKIPIGWMMPMLAAFRANVQWDRPAGTFSWTVPIDELVDLSIERLVGGIVDVHEQENSRPEYVGRNALAWRMSYTTVSQAILEWQLKKERKRPGREKQPRQG